MEETKVVTNEFDKELEELKAVLIKDCQDEQRFLAASIPTKCDAIKKAVDMLLTASDNKDFDETINTLRNIANNIEHTTYRLIDEARLERSLRYKNTNRECNGTFTAGHCKDVSPAY